MDTAANWEMEKKAFMTEIDVRPVPFLPMPTPDRDFASWLRGVEPEEILNLQEEYEGRVYLGKITEQELANWQSRHGKFLEKDEVKLEYNFLSKSCMIKSLPLATHDSLQRFFVREVNSFLERKFGKDEAEDIALVGSGTSML